MSNLIKAKSWQKGFHCVQTRHGGPPEAREFPVAASQTIVVGAPVTINTGTGEISLAAASDTSIAGVADANVTTTAADEKTLCRVILAVEDNIFMGRCDAASNTVHEGLMPGIRTNAGIWYIDIGDDNATNVVKILEKVVGDDETDSTTYGRVLFVWNRSPWLATNA